jgi:acetylornithine deacetylase/succinyl-diaminopimelate desuccinylase-like protein
MAARFPWSAISRSIWVFPTILMGFGLPDDGLHSPNEKYRLGNYYTGIMTIAHFFEQLGDQYARRQVRFPAALTIGNQD